MVMRSKRLKVDPSVSVGVGGQDPPELPGRRLTQVVRDGDPELATPGGHHEYPRANLTVVVVEERESVRLPALPIRLVGDDEREVRLHPAEQPSEADVGVGRGLRAHQRPRAVTNLERVATELGESRPHHHLTERRCRSVLLGRCQPMERRPSALEEGWGSADLVRAQRRKIDK
jgi:hypothetical protein